MKILALMAAGLIGAAALTPLPAMASGSGQTVVHERTTVRHVSNNRHNRWRWKTVCRTQWRNHHRTRVCRKVRVRW
ncbi:MAG: hypothetical protein V4610_15130 [Pseudomonadota bacterium]|jgi:hypothetical protein